MTDRQKHFLCSGLPFKRINGAPEMKASETRFGKEVNTTLANQYLYNHVYPSTLPAETTLVTFSGPIRLDEAWSNLHEHLGYREILKRCLTPAQIDLLVPKLAERFTEKRQYYLIPVKSFACDADFRKGSKPTEISHGISFYSIEAKPAKDDTRDLLYHFAGLVSEQTPGDMELNLATRIKELQFILLR